MTDKIMMHMINEFNRAAKINNASIWSRIAKLLIKPYNKKHVININKINKLTKENDVIICPCKVLGTGTINHKITIFPFNISINAINKIINAGGKIINHKDIMKKFPTGKHVIIIG